MAHLFNIEWSAGGSPADSKNFGGLEARTPIFLLKKK